MSDFEGIPMDPAKTAVVLIGYQNDYFSSRGVLHEALEEPTRVASMLANTVALVEQLATTPVLMVTTPIVFTPDYQELHDPVGILRAIQEAGAFRQGTSGAATVPELARFGDRLIEVPGKRGLNAFSNTELDSVLRDRGITHLAICGVVASICIDSTGRAAHERGYQVSMIADCISGRTRRELEFYVSEIYPLYATVLSSPQLQARLVPQNGESHHVRPRSARRSAG